MKKLISISVILLAFINVSFAQLGWNITKNINPTYSSIEALLEAEWSICDIATDGINIIIIENGEATVSTRAFPWENPLYSCKRYKNTYTSAKEFLEAEWNTCEVATDGCNTIMINNWEFWATTLAYCPEDPVYSCTKEKQMVEEKICTLEYMPVCWIDWVTYWNKCMAWDTEIVYGNKCTSMVDNDLYKKFKNNKRYAKKIKMILSKVSNSRLEKALEKANILIENTKLIRISERLQIERITKFTFLKEKIKEEMYSR